MRLDQSDETYDQGYSQPIRTGKGSRDCNCSSFVGKFPVWPFPSFSSLLDELQNWSWKEVLEESGSHCLRPWKKNSHELSSVFEQGLKRISICFLGVMDQNKIFPCHATQSFH